MTRKPAPAAVRGALDRVDPDGTVAGWCWSPDAPEVHRTIAITVDGHIVARVACDRRRDDLPPESAAHGFLVRLPAAARRQRDEVEVALRDVATGQIVGEPRKLRWGAGAPLLGNLDRVTRDGWVAGWCQDSAHPGRRVGVEILVDGAVVGTALATNWRADLQAAGIGDGRHGFSFALPYDVLARTGTLTIGVREAGGGRTLGEPATLRIGLLAEGEQRMIELEREVKLLRHRVETLTREAEVRPEADERAMRAAFATMAGFFQELADGRAGDARGFGLGPSLRATLDEFRARLPPLVLQRASANTLVLVPATAPADAVHRCLRALHAARVDAQAVLRVLDPGADPACALLPGLVGGLDYTHVGASGLVAAVRAAIEATACQAVALVDPWVDVTPGWLGESLATLAEEGAAVVGAPAVRADGLLRHGGFRVGPGGMLADPTLFADADLSEHRVLRPVDAMAPLAIVLDAAMAREAGGLDPAYTSLTHAVVALCARLRAEGRAVLCQPAASVGWAGNDAADPGLTLPDLSAPTEDARRLRLALLEASAPDPMVGEALFVDDAVPRPDRDAGSVIAVEQMRLLRGLGWRVVFAPATNAAGDDGDLRRLERIGIEVAVPPRHASVRHVLHERGERLGLVWLTRHTNAASLGPAVRELAPGAKLLFAPADLHFLRERREAALAGRGSAASRKTFAREMACVRAADATLLLSAHEQALLAAETDGSRLHVLPWIARPAPSVPGFETRAGLLFVGNFAHRPNVDAMHWFGRAVLPKLRRARPGLMLHVVGADPPAELAAPDVTVHGWVADLPALLDRVRLTIAPLRYGAGFKGKLATSLSHGVPVVATAIALEGTGLAHGDGALLADTPDDFAAAILAAHDDDARWAALSARAVERVAALYAPTRAGAVLRSVLVGLGLPVAPTSLRDPASARP